MLSASGFCVCGCPSCFNFFAFVQLLGISKTHPIVTLTGPSSFGFLADSFAAILR
jgi:hypothetical protein